jgi:hypothetical protein
MRIYLSGTANLGDFLNAMPVLSGLSKSYGKYELIVRGAMRKFVGIKEFLEYQDLFSFVTFDDEVFMYGEMIQLSSWPMREDKNDPNRPTETCRYENWMNDHYKSTFNVDDDFIVKTPEYDIEVKDEYYVGDRWAVGDIDDRRETHILSHLDKFNFIDYNRPMLENAYIIKNLKKPFITNFTGIGMLADLCNVPLYCVWKAEDWKPEFRIDNDKNISWDNGKDIDQIFAKHFYLNRKAKLVHANVLDRFL